MPLNVSSKSLLFSSRALISFLTFSEIVNSFFTPSVLFSWSYRCDLVCGSGFLQRSVAHSVFPYTLSLTLPTHIPLFIKPYELANHTVSFDSHGRTRWPLTFISHKVLLCSPYIMPVSCVVFFLRC